MWRWALGFIVTAMLCAVGPGRAVAGTEAASPDGEGDPHWEMLALGAEREGVRASLGARQPPGTTEPRRTLLRRERPQTISLGVQGSYGVVRGNSRLADGFSDGLGYAFRFRYMLSTSFALGFSFENHTYDDRGGEPSTELGAGDSSIVMTTVAIEAVKYINRAKEAHPYFTAGFGYASPDIVDEIRGTSRVNEGVFLSLGLGFERFIRPRFSLDFTLEGQALVSNSELTTFAQILGGIHLYPGD